MLRIKYFEWMSQKLLIMLKIVVYEMGIQLSKKSSIFILD
ncbi:hypothetical protein SynPROS91_01405 [Synechococcus sp. PROS-9-1]|nr:hypothetical protein SynPROS91_01405 [Synechococcus sp. PROS-9-1]